MYGTPDDFLHTSFVLPGLASGKFKSKKLKVPYGFVDSHEYDTLQGSFILHVLDESHGNVLFSIPGTMYPTLDVVGKALDITDISTSIGTGTQAACTLHSVTIDYNNIQSAVTSTILEPELYVVKACTHDINNHFMVHCDSVNVIPDIGIDNGTYISRVPYVTSDTLASIDVWIYTYNEENHDIDCPNCGELVEYAQTDHDTEAYTITAVLTDSCKYTDTFDQELLYRQIAALERQNTLTEQELGRWVIR